MNEHLSSTHTKYRNMKKYLIVALFSALATTAFSQSNFDTRRKVEVNGSAEAEVTPDIIYVGISLKEYFKDNSNKKKTDIEDHERQLLTAVTNAGVSKENFTVNNISGYATWQKKKSPDFLISKQYRIKLTDLNKFNQIMEALDQKAVQYTNIESYDYSKIESLKKDLKIKALQAAKDKATYLAKAVDDEVGDALEIQEINNEYYPQPMYRANTMLKTQMAQEESADASSPEIDFKKIKLNYQMRVVFQLK